MEDFQSWESRVWDCLYCLSVVIVDVLGCVNEPWLSTAAVDLSFALRKVGLGDAGSALSPSDSDVSKFCYWLRFLIASPIWHNLKRRLSLWNSCLTWAMLSVVSPWFLKSSSLLKTKINRAFSYWSWMSFWAIYISLSKDKYYSFTFWSGPVTVR